VLVGLARCRYRLGHAEQAEQLLERVLAAYPEHVAALRERARIALEQGREAEAQPWLQQCLVLAPDHRETLFLLSRCFERLGRPDDARRCLARQKQLDADLLRLQELARLITASPRDAALRYEAGVICLNHGREAEGLRWLAGALRVAPAHRPAHEALANYYQQGGRPDLAAYHRQQAK
jgi:predicted Zn-dependent protease